jgi:hypothetical protein
MSEQGEFKFEIEDLTPTTLSMRRLQDYLPHLVEIFGSEDDVHLLRVDEGSATPCIYAKPRVVQRVQRRLVRIKSGSGSRKSYRAMDCLNELLAEDHTSAVLHSPYFGIKIEFPGSKQAKDPVVGPIAEATELQGELIQIGGRDESISLYLRHEDEILICTASRDQGRSISEHLFRQVRISGVGRWMRSETGKWKMVNFTMATFKPLHAGGLMKAIEQLRALGRELGVKPDLVPINTDED